MPLFEVCVLMFFFLFLDVGNLCINGRSMVAI